MYARLRLQKAEIHLIVYITRHLEPTKEFLNLR